jgi:hypothetical protein
MLKLYKYLYYRLYSWNLKTWGKNDLPEWKALTGVSAMMFFNLLLIYNLLELFEIRLFARDKISNKITIIVLLILLGFNYFRFLYKKKYELLKKEFASENEGKRSRNLIYLWIYTALTFILPGIVVYLLREFGK